MVWTSTTARETIAAVDARRQGDGREKLLGPTSSRRLQVCRQRLSRSGLNGVDVGSKAVLRNACGFFDNEHVLSRQWLLTAQPLRYRALRNIQQSSRRRLRPNSLYRLTQCLERDR
jgi:hypothetical protein